MRRFRPQYLLPCLFAVSLTLPSSSAAIRNLFQAQQTATAFTDPLLPPVAAPVEGQAERTATAFTDPLPPTPAPDEAGAGEDAQEDLILIAGGPVTPGNPTIPTSYAPVAAGENYFDACNCTLDYDPVCAADGQTYGNECIATCMNQPIVSEGKCQKCSISGNASCSCAGLPYAPVCGGGKTWINSCYAECGQYFCYTPGACNYTLGSNNSLIPSTGRTPGTVAEAANNTKLPKPTSSTKDYGDALTKALLYYETQRSGTLPKRYFSWLNNSCSNCQGPGGEDVSGGYYDSGGSFLKTSYYSAFGIANLAWSVSSFADGYNRTNTTDHVNDIIKWGADYLVNCWNGTTRSFVAVVGNFTLDSNYFGPVEEYEQYVERPAYYIDAKNNPGSEIAAEAVAALVAAHLASPNATTNYLTVAKQLYSFAKGVNASYNAATSPGLLALKTQISSPGFYDELAWAAAWLYKATKITAYLTDARSYYMACCNNSGWAYDVPNKSPALHVLLTEIDPDSNATYSTNAVGFFDMYLKQNPMPHTKKGSAYSYQWSSLRQAQAVAFLALQYSSLLKTIDPDYSARLFNYAQFQVDYVLGDGGRSWVVGVGNNYPTYILHKSSYISFINWDSRGQYQWIDREPGEWTFPKPPAQVTPIISMYSKFQFESSKYPQKFLAYGALFGGTTLDDSLVRGRKDYTYTEPTTRSQAPFVGALAALASYYPNMGPIDICRLDLGWSHPNATVDSRTVCVPSTGGRTTAVTSAAG